MRTDVAAMNKVLNKELRNPGDHKFARWQALFSNFDFSIEHIKGSTNCLSDFLSREHLQLAYQSLIISMQLKENEEHMENIPDSLRWEDFTNLWGPRWELRNTKIISQTTQIPYSDLVPEVRRRGNSNVLLPVINHSNRRALQAQHALTELFHDVNLIWDIKDNEGHHQQYFCIDRPRLLS